MKCEKCACDEYAMHVRGVCSWQWGEEGNGFLSVPLMDLWPPMLFAIHHISSFVFRFSKYLFLFEFHHKFTLLLVFMGQVDFFPDIYLVFQGGWFFRGVQRYPSKKWATAPFSVQIELMGKNAFKREQCDVEFLGAICSASSYLQIVKKLPILQELGSISARVLSNQSVRACELGSFLLLGVSGTMV